MRLIYEEEDIPLKTSKLAITTIYFGILSPVIAYITTMLGLDTTPPFTIYEILAIGLLIVANISAILAFILGIIAVKRIENSDNLKGRNLALIGSVIGFLFIFLEVLFIILYFVTTRHM